MDFIIDLTLVGFHHHVVVEIFLIFPIECLFENIKCGVNNICVPLRVFGDPWILMPALGCIISVS